MNEQKLKRIIACLYAVGIIKALTAGYYILSSYEILKNIELMNKSLSIATFSSIIFSIGLIVFSYKVSEGLKNEKLWAWIAALSICTITLPSFAFPAALIGLLTLADIEIRSPFLKQLDLKF